MTLALLNPLAGDGTIVFYEAEHQYVVDGQHVLRSCTAIVSSLFAEFDPVNCIAQFYEKWKSDSGGRSDLRAIILSVLQRGGTDTDAMSAISLHWIRKRNEASRLGTEFHKHCEMDLNGEVRFVRVDSKILILTKPFLRKDVR